MSPTSIGVQRHRPTRRGVDASDSEGVELAADGMADTSTVGAVALSPARSTVALALDATGSEPGEHAAPNVCAKTWAIRRTRDRAACRRTGAGPRTERQRADNRARSHMSENRNPGE